MDSSLKGWNIDNKAEVALENSKPFEPPDHLVIDDRAGWVRSESTFRRFVLRFDVWLSGPQTRALFVFRGHASADKQVVGYAIPLPIGDDFVHSAIENARLRLLIFPKVGQSIFREWITYEVLIQRDDQTGGDHISIKKDGRVVGDTVQPRVLTTPSEALIGGPWDFGWIGFHVQNGPIYLRNVYIAPDP